MGSRSGDLDPAVPLFVARQTGLDDAAIDHALNHASGLKGLCDEHDLRRIQARAQTGDEAARLALAVYVYRLRKYIGAYLAVLGRVDALIFTAGVGENAAFVRAAVCEGMAGFGIRLDAQRNAAIASEVSEIQPAGCDPRLLVIRTNEELEIARQTATCLAATAN
jgi:acetate kinase